MLARFRSCTSGTTAIEYCLIASIVAICAVAGVTTFGSSMTNMYAYIGTKMQAMP